MKKLLCLILGFMLVLSITVTCLAAGNTLSLSDAKGGPGQTVYLTLNLNESVVASAIGVNCQFDAAILEAAPELCVWERKGLISAFEQDNQGVWAAEKAEDLKGKLCVLAFQIKDGVAFESTEVLCTVILKDGVTEKINTTVKGVITGECTHNYGDWKSAGTATHVRECALCGGKNTQNHNWDSGVKETQPSGQILLVKTCTVCGAKDATDVTTTEQGNINIPGSETDHNHTSQVPEQTEHNHDHDDASTDEHIHAETENDPITIWIVLLVPVVLIVAGVLYLKKK